MRRWERAGAGDMNDDVCNGCTKQDDDHDVADAAHGTAAANVIPGKRRENARGTGGVGHSFARPVNFVAGRWLKPKELEKVAEKNAQRPK